MVITHVYNGNTYNIHRVMGINLLIIRNVNNNTLVAEVIRVNDSYTVTDVRTNQKYRNVDSLFSAIELLVP